MNPWQGLIGLELAKVVRATVRELHLQRASTRLRFKDTCSLSNATRFALQWVALCTPNGQYHTHIARPGILTSDMVTARRACADGVTDSQFNVGHPINSRPEWEQGKTWCNGSSNGNQFSSVDFGRRHIASGIRSTYGAIP
jgi:hypothetical protein